MPNGLFKYFPTDSDKLKRFVNGQIYLTPPRYFNDPWDFLLRSEPPSEELLKKEVPFLDTQSIREFQGFVSSADSLEEEAHEQQDGLSEISGLVCLTEKPLDRVMWAHYGESHQGFVAEFGHSREEAKTECGFRCCGAPFGPAVKVEYQETLPALKRDTSNMEQAILTKHVCWTYEQEWRVVRPLTTGYPHPMKKGFVLVEFKPSHLLRVILGLRVAREVEFQLRQMLNREEFRHVRKEMVRMDPNSRELISKPLQW